MCSNKDYRGPRVLTISEIHFISVRIPRWQRLPHFRYWTSRGRPDVTSSRQMSRRTLATDSPTGSSSEWSVVATEPCSPSTIWRASRRTSTVRSTSQLKTALSWRHDLACRRSKSRRGIRTDGWSGKNRLVYRFQSTRCDILNTRGLSQMLRMGDRPVENNNSLRNVIR